jgi:ABC-type lipoprotein release transport system permease subunit
VGPTIVTGRLPARDGEVLLGRHTARRLGVHEGDQVDVEAGPEGHVTATVVGTAVLNSNISPTMQIGDGALVSIAQLEEMIPDQRVTFLLAKISDGSDPDEVIASVNRTWGDDANAAPPLLSGDVVNLRRVRQLPIGLAFGLGLAALVLLAFALALSTRRRRLELAVLRALGGTRRQANATLVWQGIWIALGAAAIGVPAGVIIGRAIWSRLSDDLGTITEPVVPWPQLLLLVAVGTAVTGVIATVPAVLAGRRALATTLRTE